MTTLDAKHVHQWKDAPDWHAGKGRKAQECFPCRGLRFVPLDAPETASRAAARQQDGGERG